MNKLAVWPRVRHRLLRWLHKPSIRVRNDVPLVRLGTKYGGWIVVDTGELQGCTAITCGLDEDASFDVELARRYNARVIAVDPTPRAIAHYEAVRRRFGLSPAAQPDNSGRLDPSSYDLRKLDETRFALIEGLLSV